MLGPSQFEPDEIMLFDFEPHKDLYEHLDKVARVGVFGHHPIRDDILDFEKRENVTYFNPHRVLPDSIEIGDEKYERGAPILLPLSMAERDINFKSMFTSFDDSYAKFIASFGMRGYGYGRLARSFEKRVNFRLDARRCNTAIRAINLLFSYSLDNSKKIVDNLSSINSYRDGKLSAFSEQCYRKNVYNTCETIAAASISKSRRFGNDIILFPVDKAPFEQIKAIVGEIEINRKGKGKWPLRIYADLSNGGPQIKFSLRSDEISIPELLKRSYSNIEVLEENFGGHKHAAGVVCSKGDAPKIMRSVVNEYYLAKDESDDFVDEDFYFLNGLHKTQKKLF